MTPVVVTGCGTLSSLGLGRSALLGALRTGSPATSLGDFGLSDWIPPMLSRRMSAPSRFAVVAALDALRDAGRPAPEISDPAGGVALATSFGPCGHTQLLLDQILDEGPQAASPAIFTECVANAPASRVSIRLKLTGPNFTIGGRESAGLTAVSRAFDEIRAQRAGWMLAGNVDEITPLLRSVLHAFGALGSRPRPFDGRRDGLFAADGATIWVLETEAAAKLRGARPLARIRAHASAFDWTAGRANWGEGSELLAAALTRMLRGAAVAPAEIDLIVSGASGSRSGDRLEARTLMRVWGRHPLPLLTTPKRVTGEYGGSFLAATIEAIEHGACAGAVEGFERDPELDLEPLAQDLPAPPRRVLVSGLSSGGTASWLLLERP